MEPLVLKQGTTRTITVTGLRTAANELLDPTRWGLHAVARPGIWADPVAVWRDTPGVGEHLAEVVPADPTVDPTVSPGEKWLYLHIAPVVSDTWEWATANLDIEISEPSTGRQETFSRILRLDPTTVRS